jgi:hypothetical protein
VSAPAREDASPARPPGRPRSAEADEAILRAALDLLAAEGYRALTMEGVRERSGVGKATLYRRYGSKEELVRAAIVHLNNDIPMPQDTGSLAGDFAATAQKILAGGARTGALALMPRLLSEVAGDPEMHALFSETWSSRGGASCAGSSNAPRRAARSAPTSIPSSPST